MEVRHRFVFVDIDALGNWCRIDGEQMTAESRTLWTCMQCFCVFYYSSYSHFYVGSMFVDIRLHVARSCTSSLSVPSLLYHPSLGPTIFSYPFLSSASLGLPFTLSSYLRSALSSPHMSKPLQSPMLTIFYDCLRCRSVDSRHLYLVYNLI